MLILFILLGVSVVVIIRFAIKSCARASIPVSHVLRIPVVPESQCRGSDEVRPAAVYTIASDPRGNQSTNNFTDFFWDVSPQNTRSNQEKDEKDLPSYEEVMRMEMERQVMDSRVQAPTTTLALPNTVETVSAPVRLTV